ncbi:MAG: elongation factor P hydroxylase [Verrucomicrobia bacterium]|nr:elongation factor P hydroxylase [Verrucomicrobiota bacterium]
MHQYQDLINIFNDCFLEKYNTVLVKGTDEPIYLPANENQMHHSIFFAHGFFASALHECSHWLIAGNERRTQVDFGYWYIPDGRTSSEQTLFQSVEIKPQALEWILSTATGYRFYPSIDNLNGSESDTYTFKLNVYRQVKTYCEKGLPDRARIFREALCQFYKTKPSLEFEDFDIQKIL